MEQFNYKSDFENFLKHSIEDFIMIPQRKVWYGIYNHLHPEKRWPSIAVSLLILISILHIGVTNNKTINKEQLLAQSKLQILNIKSSPSNIAFNNTISENNFSTKKNQSTNKNRRVNNSNSIIIKPVSFEKTVAFEKLEPSSKDLSKYSNKNLPTENVFYNNNNNTEQQGSIVSNESNDVETNYNSISNDFKNEAVVKIENSIPVFETENKPEIKTTLVQTTNEVASIQLPKKTSNTSISYYLTPSLGYRTFQEKKLENKSISSNRVYGASASSSPLNLQDEKSVNIEFGVVAQHKLNKNHQLKIGAQFNYTNYVSSVGYLKNRIQNTLALNNTIPQYELMDYESTPGNAKINKTTLQLSVPIGIDKKIIGNEKIAWYVGATIQPTYVFGGSAYVLSNDTKNYSNQKDLLRRFNINAAAETFLSIKTANGIHLNVGPQVRRQLLNTFKSNYNYSEKLYNIGVKVGVNTSF